MKGELAAEEDAELEQGVALNEMSASSYIGGVIALEDVWYVHLLNSNVLR